MHNTWVNPLLDTVTGVIFTNHFRCEKSLSWVETLWGVELVWGMASRGSWEGELSNKESVIQMSSVLPGSLHKYKIKKILSKLSILGSLTNWLNNECNCLDLLAERTAGQSFARFLHQGFEGGAALLWIFLNVWWRLFWLGKVSAWKQLSQTLTTKRRDLFLLKLHYAVKFNTHVSHKAKANINLD